MWSLVPRNVRRGSRGPAHQHFCAILRSRGRSSGCEHRHDYTQKVAPAESDCDISISASIESDPLKTAALLDLPFLLSPPRLAIGKLEIWYYGILGKFPRLVKDKRWEEPHALQEDMHAKGMPVSSNIWQNVVNYFAENRCFESALHIWNLVQKTRYLPPTLLGSRLILFTLLGSLNKTKVVVDHLTKRNLGALEHYREVHNNSKKCNDELLDDEQHHEATSGSDLEVGTDDDHDLEEPEPELLDREHLATSDSDLEVETDDELDLDEATRRMMEPEPEPERKIVRPSVTWGVLFTQEQRHKSHKSVIEYLKGEGLSTSELMDIELPITVEVMEERVKFLRKIGLDNTAINHYPLILGCSVRKNMVPVLKYLNKLGLPRHCVAAFLRKYPMILHASIVIDILPVVYFLRGLDIAMEDVPKVLLKYPEVLSFKPEGTMSTSVGYLVSLGVKMRHVGQMLTEHPQILGMRVATMIKPKVDYLLSLGLPQMILMKILERRPHVLGYDLVNRMQYNVDRLLKVGVRQEAIPGIIAQYPEVLGRVLDKALDYKVEWLKRKLQLDLQGPGKMIEKMPQIIFIQESVAIRRIEFLKRQGFSTKDVGVMATQCPQLLVLNVTESLKPNMAFLADMKRDKQEVVEFPEYFTYGLETRIRPRHKAVLEKNILCSLEWLLNCTDLEFQNRLASGHEDKDAGPSFIMGGVLAGKEEIWQPSLQQRFAFS